MFCVVSSRDGRLSRRPERRKRRQADRRRQRGGRDRLPSPRNRVKLNARKSWYTTVSVVCENRTVFQSQHNLCIMS